MSNPLYIYHMSTRLIGSRGLVNMKQNMKMDQNNMRLFRTSFTGLLIRKLCFLSFLFFSVNSVALNDGTWTYEIDVDNVEITGCSAIKLLLVTC